MPFAVGLLLAYLLMPLFRWLEAKLPGKDNKWAKTKRIGLICLSFVLILMLLALLGYYIITSVAQSFAMLAQSAPQYFSKGLGNLQNWLQDIREWLPPEVYGEMDKLVENIAVLAGNAVRSVFTKSVSMISASATLILSLVSVPVFLFYILKDWEKLTQSLYTLLGSRSEEQAKSIINMLDRVIGSWLKSQIVLAAAVFVMCLAGLSILGVGLAPALAVLAGLMEFVPIIGPWISGITAVIVVLAIAPDKALWVALLYILVQLLENSILRPKIQGSYLQIHPVMIIVLLPVATYIAGIWGMVLYVPITALAVEIFKYMRQKIAYEKSR